MAQCSQCGRCRRQEGDFYNGQRPAGGSFAIEDDGVALRQLAWGQYKKKIDRWFFWSATYYNNYQGGLGHTNVFVKAATFSGPQTLDVKRGITGWNYSNGDGVLFYPGIDRKFPEQSRDLHGPIASLRLKHWRRGIQDVDYLTMAAKVNPAATAALVQRMVPRRCGNTVSPILLIPTGWKRQSAGAPIQISGKERAWSLRTPSKVTKATRSNAGPLPLAVAESYARWFQ